MRRKKSEKSRDTGRSKEPGGGRRYPEQEIVDALNAEGTSSRRAGTEQQDHFRAVTGKAGRTSGDGD